MHGGKIIITAKERNGFNKELPAMTTDNAVEISVKDTGIGMSKEILENLFILEKQTNRKGTDDEPSTGLGLLLCKDFIEKNRGKIWVESEEGKGSTINFTLKASKGQ
jgi:signal transduction histidine kinase